MNTLFIDTHYLDIIIAYLENGQVVDKKEVINKKNNSEHIFPTIVEVIKERPIDEVIVVNGPGSFTGVRIGVTIAKTYGWSLNKKVIPISSLEVLSSTDTDKKYVASLIDARRGCLCWHL